MRPTVGVSGRISPVGSPVRNRAVCSGQRRWLVVVAVVIAVLCAAGFQVLPQTAHDEAALGTPASWRTTLAFPWVVHLPEGSSDQVVSSWQSMNPGFQVRVWLHSQQERFVAARCRSLRKAWAGAGSTVRVELWKYCLLLHEGGVVASGGAACTQPIQSWASTYRIFSATIDFIVGVEMVAGGREGWSDFWVRKIQIADYVVAAAAGHPAAAAAVSRASDSAPGPGLWTDAVADHLRDKHSVHVGEDPFSPYVLQTRGVYTGTTLLLPLRGFGLAGHVEKIQGCYDAREVLVFHRRDRQPPDLFWSPLTPPAAPTRRGPSSLDPLGFAVHTARGTWGGGEELCADGGCESPHMPRQDCAARCLDRRDCVAFSHRIAPGKHSYSGCPTHDCGTCTLHNATQSFQADPKTAAYVRTPTSFAPGYDDMGRGRWAGGSGVKAAGVGGCAAACSGDPLCKGFATDGGRECQLSRKPAAEFVASRSHARAWRAFRGSTAAPPSLPGFWRRPVDGHWHNHGNAHADTSVAACSRLCAANASCRGFEVYMDSGAVSGQCYLFDGELELPFSPNSQCRTYVKADPAYRPQRGRKRVESRAPPATTQAAARAGLAVGFVRTEADWSNAAGRLLCASCDNSALSREDCAARCTDNGPSVCAGFTHAVSKSRIARLHSACPTHDCGPCTIYSAEAVSSAAGEPKRVQVPHAVSFVLGDRPPGFRPYAGGYWSNAQERKSASSVAECADVCRQDGQCRGFEVFTESRVRKCYVFVGELREPFSYRHQCTTFLREDSTPTPDGFARRAVDGHWSNHGIAHPGETVEGCAKRCRSDVQCHGFEVFVGTRNDTAAGSCYLFRGDLELPFSPNPGCRTYMKRDPSKQAPLVESGRGAQPPVGPSNAPPGYSRMSAPRAPSAFDVVLPSLLSASGCAARCNERHRCTAFTTVPARGSGVKPYTDGPCPYNDCALCRLSLQPADGAASSVPVSGSVSYAPTAGTPAGYLEAGPGRWSDGDRRDAAGVEGCGEVCSEDPSCEGFSTDGGGRCETRQRRDGAATRRPAAGLRVYRVDEAAPPRLEGFRRLRVDGYWRNHDEAVPNKSVRECAALCAASARCRGFEVWFETSRSERGNCHVFNDLLRLPFSPSTSCRTYVKAAAA